MYTVEAMPRRCPRPRGSTVQGLGISVNNSRQGIPFEGGGGGRGPTCKTVNKGERG